MINGARDNTTGRVKASPLARRMARERGVELDGLIGTGPDGRIIAEDIERAEAAPAEASAAPGRTGRPGSRARRGRVGAAHEHPPDDRPPADRGLAGSRLPADRLGRDDPGQHADRAFARARPRRSRHRHRPAREGLRARADAPSRRERPVRRRVAAAVPVGEHRDRRRCTAGARRPGDPVGGAALALRRSPRRARRSSRRPATRPCSSPTSKAAPSRSRTSACSASSSSSPCSTRRRRRSSPSAPRSTGRSSVDGEIVVRPMMTITLTVDHRAVDGGPAADFLRTVKTFLEDPALAL